jgi:hypothetical protein
MPAVKKTVAKPAAKPSAKPAAAKKPAAKKPAAKKGGALEIAPIAATGLLLVAQKMYKEMMAEEEKRPAKRTLRTRRGGDGPESYPIDTSAEEDGAPDSVAETAADAPASEELAPAEAPAPAPATAEPEAAPASEAEAEPVAEEAASNPTLVDAAATVINNMNDEDKAKVKGMLTGGAKKARKPSAKRGGSAGIVGADLQAMAGGSEMSMPAPLAGGAKKARKPSAKRGGGEVNAVMPLIGGSELSMPAPLAGGAKKARKPSAKRGGGEMLSMPAPLAGGSEKLTMPAPLAGGAKKATKRGGGALAPIAAVAGGMPLAPANTAPLYPESTSQMAGGAKKAAKKPTKRMAGGELAAYTAQLSKLTSQLRTLM